ncbi:MAG: exodeoxyribonuclease VII large subunit [Candidatus Pacebacteria bacterium]|nr:exodeoxyribonuclease VII large subunit [Candidatus Paceibacterota bacterium]
MNPNLLRKLKAWRDATAKREMVEIFRVLPNRAIEDVARMEPKTREELTSIKGIKDKKYYKYGKEILDMVKESLGNDKIDSRQPFFPPAGQAGRNIILPERQSANRSFRESEGNSESYHSSLRETPAGREEESTASLDFSATDQKEKIYSVSEFLDHLNEKLTSEEVRLKGEVTSVDEREKVVYFSLKDEKDDSVINCLIFRYQYEISGVKIKIGNEIIASGRPEIYKPYGKLSLKTSLVEVAGEGALKKAYDEIKNKLEKEGLFALERKKSLPELPETIGLITSSKGAAIGDFTTNLGSYGFKIKFIDSSVEGKQAVFDLIKAVRQFRKIKKIDALVIVRGGGSLESLQAFNNEALVREIADLNIPVICGVGHEKDISLVSLVSDLAVSTPTAAARAIRESWDKAFEKLNRNEAILINSFEKYLYESKHKIERISFSLNQKFENILQRFTDAENNFLKIVKNINYAIDGARHAVDDSASRIFSNYSRKIIDTKNKINIFENAINASDPERQLKLGYSIVSFGGKIVRSIKQVGKGDAVDIKISDGKIEAEVRGVGK